MISELDTARPLWIERLHDQRVSAVGFDDGLLWTAGFDGIVVAWDLELGQVRLSFDAGHGRILSLRSGYGALATVGDDGHARLWDPATISVAQSLDEKRFGPAYSVALTPDWIAIGYESGHVAIWKPAVPATTILGAGWQYEGDFQPNGRGPLYAIAVSPSRQLVAVARERAVGLHEPGEWPQIQGLSIPVACNDLQFNSTGTLLAGACSDRQVRLWDWKPKVGRQHAHWTYLEKWLGEGMQRDPWRREMIFSGARFAGDDRIIAASFDGSVRLYPADRWATSPLRIAWQGLEVPGGWEEWPNVSTG